VLWLLLAPIALVALALTRTASGAAALPRPHAKSWGVPFAATVGRVWPVPAEPRLVAYTDVSGVVHGNGGVAFHASREGGTRHHAGIDLPCAPGDAIVAMEDGVVLGSIPGFVKLDAVVVQHSRCVAVYAEVAFGLAALGLKKGDRVKAGQTIAKGALNYEGHSMLHLETWAIGHAPAMYTPWRVGSPPPEGLLDPTEYLLTLAAG